VCVCNFPFLALRTMWQWTVSPSFGWITCCTCAAEERADTKVLDCNTSRRSVGISTVRERLMLAYGRWQRTKMPFVTTSCSVLFSHSVDRASWYTCIIKTNKMHFSFLIYFNNLSSTCFEYSNYSSSGGSYCICSIWYLSCIYVD